MFGDFENSNPVEIKKSLFSNNTAISISSNEIVFWLKGFVWVFDLLAFEH